jgi:hypothetical protein
MPRESEFLRVVDSDYDAPEFGGGDDGGSESTLSDTASNAASVLATVVEEIGGSASWRGSVIVDGSEHLIEITITSNG